MMMMMMIIMYMMMVRMMVMMMIALPRLTNDGWMCKQALSEGKRMSIIGAIKWLMTVYDDRKSDTYRMRWTLSG